MQRSFIQFHRAGKPLHTSKLNGFPLVSFGAPVGSVGGVDCYESVTITTGGQRLRKVTTKDLGGPVSIRLVTRGQKPQWFALADETTSPSHPLETTSRFESVPATSA